MKHFDLTHPGSWLQPCRLPLETMGYAAATVLGLFAWLSTAGKSVAFATLLLVFLLDRNAWKASIRDPVFILLALFALLVIASALSAGVEFPDSRTLQRKDATAWLSLLAFWPMGWYLAGLPDRVHRLLLLSLVGLITGMLIHAKLADLILFRLPPDIASRTGFQLGFFFSGLVSGSALLGLALFAPRILKPGPIRPVRILLWLIAVDLMCHMLLASYSRASWLALALTFAGMIAFGLRLNRSGWRKLGIGSLLAGLILAVGLQEPIRDRVLNRLMAEQETYQVLLRGDFEHLPATSIGYRISVERFGLQRWLERPWFGWGAGSTQYLITHSHDAHLLHPGQNPNSDERQWMSHFHNAYLEILVRFGLTGFFLLAGAFSALLSGLFRAYRNGKISPDSFRFCLGCFFMAAIWSLFDFRLLHGDWRAYWIILAGIAHSYTLASLRTPDYGETSSCAA